MTKAGNKQGNDIGWNSQDAHNHPNKVRHKRRPCGTGPTFPANVTEIFETTEKLRHDRIRVKVIWGEVDKDTSGETGQKIGHYVTELQWSKDNITYVDPARRHVTSAKLDSDNNATAYCYFRGHIHKKRWYRARVRTVSRAGCKGDWSPYTNGATPSDTIKPPPPQLVIITPHHQHVLLDWTAPTEADTDIMNEDIAYFQAQIFNNSAFGGTPYRFDKYQHPTKRGFHIENQTPDEDDTYYGRVRSVDSSQNKSAWIPAKRKPGNSNAGAAPDGVHVHPPYHHAVFTKPGTVAVKHYPQLWTAHRTLRFKNVRARVGHHDAATHPNDGCPIGAAMIINIIWGNQNGDLEQHILQATDALHIDGNSHKDVDFLSSFSKLTMDKNETLSIKVIQVGSTTAGSDLVVTVNMVPVDD